MRPCMESNAKTGGDQRERSECLPVAHACTFRRLHCRHVRFQPPHIHKNGDNFPNKERDNEKNTNLISLLISRKKKKKTFQNSWYRIIFKLSFQKKTGRNVSIYFFIPVINNQDSLVKNSFPQTKKIKNSTASGLLIKNFMAITQDSRVSSAKFSTELHNSNYRLRVDASLRRYTERERERGNFEGVH